MNLGNANIRQIQAKAESAIFIFGMTGLEVRRATLWKVARATEEARLNVKHRSTTWLSRLLWC